MENLAGYIATGIVSLFVGVLLMYLQPKAKVVFWSPHSFLFNLTRENVVLQTDALTLHNLGRKLAENVEIIFNGRPDFFQFAPAINHTTESTENNQFVIRILSMGPKEQVTLQLLSYTRVPKVLNIRSSAGRAAPVPFQIQRVFPKWFNLLALVFLLTGMGFTGYWLVKAIIFISKSIGIV